jgi:Rod binding domain-containing protein
MDISLGTKSIVEAAFVAREQRLEAAQTRAEQADVARKMEGIFAQLFVKELRRGLGDGFFGQGAGYDTFEGWFDEQLGESLVEDGVLDLAGRIRASLASKNAALAAEEALMAQSEGNQEMTP